MLTLSSRLTRFVTISTALLQLGLAGFSSPTLAADEVVVYSGRAERLIKPVLDAFQSKTGIQVNLLSSGSTELVNRLQAEGDRTSADVFITNDIGALERARQLRLLAPVDLEDIDAVVPPQYRAPDQTWVGLSERFWTIVYNPTQIKPSDISSILDLADPRWKGKLGIPNAGSEYLQAGVSIIMAIHGEERTLGFLKGLKTNAGSMVFGKSSQIVDAVAKGQVALGLVNHYYVYRHLAKDPSAAIAVLMTDQQDGGMGTIVNAAGVGLVAHTQRRQSARRLLDFLISRDGQKMFADLNKEYPVHPGVTADPALPPRTSFRAAGVPLARLGELREPAATLIERAGLR